jgi:hypothetical protein
LAFLIALVNGAFDYILRWVPVVVETSST